jgi:transposase
MPEDLPRARDAGVGVMGPVVGPGTPVVRPEGDRPQDGSTGCCSQVASRQELMPMRSRLQLVPDLAAPSITAMRPYSIDLRERVAAAGDDGEGSQRDIASTFRVSLSFVSRLLRRRCDVGTLAPKPHGGSPPPALGPDDRQRLDELIGEPPDATREPLRQRGGFRCRLTTVWRALRRRRLTRQKTDLHADERDRPDVPKKRRSFRRKVKRIEPERLIFVDETGVTTARTPADGWAPRGQRVTGSAPASWETVTVIAALGRDGVRAPLAFPGSTDTVAFQTSVEQALVPALHAGDVVVFDNLGPHRAPGVAKSIEHAGGAGAAAAAVEPGRHPDRRDMVSKVKAYLWRAAARTKGGLYDALGEALRRVTDRDILGWFQHTGLCATHG